MDPIIFRGLGQGSSRAAPLLLTRTDQNFIKVLLGQLATSDPRGAIDTTIAGDRDSAGKLKLFQPVHRTFQVALLEAACGIPGEPRLDPTKIDSAGLVVRRLSRVTNNIYGTRTTYPFAQGWMSAARSLRGWVSFESAGDGDLDPDPARRPQPDAGTTAATARLQALLAGPNQPLGEATVSLFVAPPDVCAAARRTLLFGVVPTSSLETSEAPAKAGDRFFQSSDITAMLPAFFRGAAVSPRATLGSFAGRTATYSDAADWETAETRLSRDLWVFKNFMQMLRQLATQFRAFDDTDDARLLLAALNRVQLPFGVDPRNRPAGDYLREAARILVLEPDTSGTQQIVLPTSWPVFPNDVAGDVQARIAALAEASYAALVPRAARFDDTTALYQVRAFVRVKRDDGCPPVTIWTDPSESFSIAPWYDNGKLPPVQVQMPDINRQTVKALRPNVALKLPRKLFNFLNENDPKDLIDGKGKEGTEIGLDWICGFNIPIITLCAFIVLFIFLVLLNIVFWWLPFIKICFPIPTVKREDS